MNNRITLQELITGAIDQNCEVDKKTLELMRKYLIILGITTRAL